MEKPKNSPYIDPESVNAKQVKRLDDFASSLLKSLMSRYEYMFTDDVPDRKIIVKEELNPNSVDLPQMYRYNNLYYVIYRDGEAWCLRIMDGIHHLVTVGYKKL